MLDWIQTYEPAFWWLFTLSIMTFFATLIVVPMLLVRLPPDYFAHDKRERLTKQNHNLLVKTVLVILKNVLGCVLMVMGLVMLFTPGQGLITMFVGLMLVNYPGKYSLERWLVSRPAIFRSINWLRRGAGRPELTL